MTVGGNFQSRLPINDSLLQDFSEADRAWLVKEIYPGLKESLAQICQDEADGPYNLTWAKHAPKSTFGAGYAAANGPAQQAAPATGGSFGGGFSMGAKPAQEQPQPGSSFGGGFKMGD